MLRENVGESRILLGLDLATRAGYCWTRFSAAGVEPIQPVRMGQLDLSIGEYDSGALRFLRLENFLEHLRPAAVAMEDRQFSLESMRRMGNTSTRAIEMSAAFRITVAKWCERNKVACFAVRIQAVKKFATGLGNASKEAVIAACNARFGTTFPTANYESTGVDNVCDAAFVLATFLNEYPYLFPPVDFDYEMPNVHVI